MEIEESHIANGEKKWKTKRGGVIHTYTNQHVQDNTPNSFKMLWNYKLIDILSGIFSTHVAAYIGGVTCNIDTHPNIEIEKLLATIFRTFLL